MKRVANVELLNELLTIERRGWDSLCHNTGADFYGSLMVNDGVMDRGAGIAYGEGNSPAFRSLMSSIYVRVDGDWKLVFYQQTPIPSQAE